MHCGEACSFERGLYIEFTDPLLHVLRYLQGVSVHQFNSVVMTMWGLAVKIHSGLIQEPKGFASDSLINLQPIIGNQKVVRGFVDSQCQTSINSPLLGDQGPDN